MKILITGANGQLGHACRTAFRYHDLWLTDVDTLDITDEKACRSAMEHFLPELVIHTAALTDVSRCEREPAVCYRLNVWGTYVVAVAAQACNAAMVYVSTDYVFDGTKGKPYAEDDIPHPLSVYGRSKQCGEDITRDIVSRHYVVRTAWLYGEGKNFVRSILAQAERQRELAVVADQYGSPTYALDLARFIKVIVEKGEPGTYHAVNAGETAWIGLAEAALQAAGHQAMVTPLTTDEARQRFADPVPRPAYSVLDPAKLQALTPVREWRDALRDYLGPQFGRAKPADLDESTV